MSFLFFTACPALIQHAYLKAIQDLILPNDGKQIREAVAAKKS